MKEWTKVFKALGNESRLKIIRLLHSRKRLPVGKIAWDVGISLKGTSKHLALLKGLNILENEGKSGRVWYYLSPSMRDEVRHVVEKFLKHIK